MTKPITPLIDDRCTQLGITVAPPQDTTRVHWELSHLFLTEGGNWNGVPPWAEPFQNDHLGGDRHVYYLGVTMDGRRATEKGLFILGWPDTHALGSPDGGADWWGNVPINAGFDWSKGETGPYYGQVNAISSSIVRGLGLPYPPYPWGSAFIAKGSQVYPVHRWNGRNYIGDVLVTENEVVPMGGLHTSFFLVFQEVDAYSVDPEPEPEPEPGQLQRVLKKAEDVASDLYDNHEFRDAGDILVSIADVLARLEIHQDLSSPRALLRLPSASAKCCGEE